MGILRQDAGNKIVSMSSPVPAVIKIVSSKLAFYSIFNSWIKTNHPPCQRTELWIRMWMSECATPNVYIMLILVAY